MTPGSTTSAVSLRGAAVRFGDRTLWEGLDLDVAPGEFVAVLGPNGSGKTTLIKALLGLVRLSAGTAHVGGTPVGRQRGSTSGGVGVIPQQRPLPEGTPLRGRDLVRQGLDGTRWGPAWLDSRRKADRARVDAMLERVGATAFAERPVWTLSGGEQQRLRAAQALVSSPAVMLCDEPLLSLDVRHQQEITQLIAEQAKQEQAAVLFITHEINPVLPYVDRVLYLAQGRFRVGAPDEVITTESLSDLFGRRVDVVRVGDRLAILGGEDHVHHDHDEEAGA
ncbi:MAG: metal ABC transporter ATP-binding protein [Galactobacter sp.]|uniref:metal ABC transporter ATP-binding protein n=1 Tax=Galactobacter sp. TaxID=2676125 RepID=UPI0025BA2C63|nr:metal ABC transporter ATP-binding protein [Galactobacter sp.]